MLEVNHTTKNVLKSSFIWFSSTILTIALAGTDVVNPANKNSASTPANITTTSSIKKDTANNNIKTKPKQKVASYAVIEDRPCEPGRLCFIPVHVDNAAKKDKNILSLPTMLISQLIKSPDLANNNKCRGYYAIFKKDDNGDDICNVPKCELAKKAFKADIGNCCFNAFKTMSTEKESPIQKTLSKEEWKKHLLQNKDMCAYYDSHTQGQPVAPAAIN